MAINQGGFVPGIGYRHRVIYQEWITLRLTLISSADYRRPEPLFFQMMSESDDERCFPRSTHRDVSDHNDGTG